MYHLSVGKLFVISYITLTNNCLFNAQMFCDFFERRLADIQSSTVLNITSISRILVPPPASPVLFPGFSPVTTSEASILIQSLTKSCSIYIIPFSLMKSCCSLFSVLLAELGNRSFPIYFIIYLFIYFRQISWAL